MAADDLSMRDYRFLLTGGVSLEDPPAKPEQWIPERCWGELFRLSLIDEMFSHCLTSFTEEAVKWKAVYDSVDPLAVMQNPETRPSMLQEFDQFNDLMVF